jgi:hypothetical protein
MGRKSLDYLGQSIKAGGNVFKSNLEPFLLHLEPRQDLSRGFRWYRVVRMSLRSWRNCRI